jgi:hypothetical protein
MASRKRLEHTIEEAPAIRDGADGIGFSLKERAYN